MFFQFFLYPFLILDFIDFSTSAIAASVDSSAEELIQKATKVITKNRTSLIIAHRLSTIKNADRILVLDKGKIVEEGTHKSLLKEKGQYYELYQHQFLREENIMIKESI